MVWPYGLCSPFLINHTTSSERTEVATVPAGTLWDGTYDDTNSTVLSTELDRASAVSTNSTDHASTTYTPCLSSFRVSSDTTLLTFSTYSHFTVSTQINWHHSPSLSVQLWPH